MSLSESLFLSCSWPRGSSVRASSRTAQIGDPTMTDPQRDIERFRAMREALRDAVRPPTTRTGLIRRAQLVVVGKLQR
jgi:hypothetical protein